MPQDQLELVFLLDVDNTLLDNDRLKADLDSGIRTLIGEVETDRFWEVYEEVRRQEDYVDYPASIKRWARVFGTPQQGRALMKMIDDVDFKAYVYPRALDTIAHLWSFGTVAILSDGDTVFQPMKIERSGLEEAVHGNVIITIHKELEMKKVFERFPADTYVIVDDKPRILAVFERECPALYTTVLVLQGHYGVEGQYAPEPDIAVKRIGDLRRFGKRRFLEEAHKHRVTGAKQRSS